MLTPARLIDSLTLADGTRAPIRQLCHQDRDRFAQLFDRLSPQSRYLRYLTPKHSLTASELSFLVGVDHRDHEALAAIDPRDGSLLGVARYVVYAGNPAVADAAVEVVDERHRQGIGRALLTRLIARARDNDIELLTATVLWQNRPARSLFRQLGFHARGSAGGEIELKLDLGTAN